MRDPTAKPRIESHTALRGIAAFAVMCGHYTGEFGRNIGGTDYFIPRTHVAVDFFFLLSGFILYVVYADGFAAGITRASYGNFLLRRLARIYPLHLATLFLVLALFRFHVQPEDQGVLWLNLGLIHAWGFTDRFLFNSPSWSISCEFAAYLLFPLLALLIARGPARLPLLIAALLAYALLWHLGGGSLDLDAIGRQNVLWRVAAAFPIGMLLGHLARQGSLAHLPNPSLLQFLSVALFLLALILGLPDLLLIVPLILIVVVTITQDGALCRLLRTTPLVWLGEVSYGLYLLHWPVMLFLYNLRPKLAPALGPNQLELTAAAIFLVLVPALAALSHLCFEQPILRYVRRRTGPGSRPVPVPR